MVRLFALINDDDDDDDDDSGEALCSSSGSGRSPAAKCFFGAFSPQSEVSGNEDFRLNFPLPSIPVPSHSPRSTSTSISRRQRHKAPITAAREYGCSLPWP